MHNSVYHLFPVFRKDIHAWSFLFFRQCLRSVVVHVARTYSTYSSANINLVRTFENNNSSTVFLFHCSSQKRFLLKLIEKAQFIPEWWEMFSRFHFYWGARRGISFKRITRNRVLPSIISGSFVENIDFFPWISCDPHGTVRSIIVYHYTTLLHLSRNTFKVSKSQKKLVSICNFLCHSCD